MLVGRCGMDSGTSRQTARARSHSWEQRVSFARYTSGLTQLILKIICDTIDFQALSQAMPTFTKLSQLTTNVPRRRCSLILRADIGKGDLFGQCGNRERERESMGMKMTVCVDRRVFVYVFYIIE